MKKQAGLLAMMSMAASMGGNEFNETFDPKPTEKEIEEKKALAFKEKNKKQGIQEYFYGQNVIYARNKKNADWKETITSHI